jgi:hypothetical protein
VWLGSFLSLEVLAVESYAPWLYRRWDLDHARWQVKILGIAFALFGITAVVLWVFIYYFQ